MLTTYGMVLHNASQLMSGKGSAVARGEQGGTTGPFLHDGRVTLDQQ